MPRPTIATLQATLAERDREVVQLGSDLMKANAALVTAREKLVISQADRETHRRVRHATEAAIEQELCIEYCATIGDSIDDGTPRPIRVLRRLHLKA